jgi:NitT/TauT family transport system substrate-binding protein
MRRPLTAGAALAAFVLLLAACGDDGDAGDAGAEGEGANGEPTQEVTFGVATQALIVSLSPYTTVPEELGYFEEEGLEVEVLGFAGGGPTVQALDAGQIDVAIPPATSLFAAVSEGSEVKSFYTQITRNYLNPMVPEDSPIEDVLDLEGTTIGPQSLDSANVPLIRAMVAQEGGDPDSIDFVATGGPAEAMSFLQSGEIDALALWDAAYADIEAQGQPLREISTDFFRELGFHQGLIALEERIQEDRDMLVGMGRAISKGMVFADENPEAAIRLYWEENPESRPADIDEDEAMDNALRTLEARGENTEPVDGVWGLSTEEQVREHLEIVVEFNDLNPLEVSDVWTDELLDEINDFDEDAIREEAREFEVDG